MTRSRIPHNTSSLNTLAEELSRQAQAIKALSERFDACASSHEPLALPSKQVDTALNCP